MSVRQRKQIFKASVLVAISGILYGFLGYLGTRALQDNMTISPMLFWRFCIAGCWMIPFAIIKNLRSSTLDKNNRRILLFMFSLGALLYAGGSAFYFVASFYTGTGIAMVIFFSYPILVALISWLAHKHQFNGWVLLTLVVMTAGLFLLRGAHTHDINSIGIFFGVLSAACYGLYVISSKRMAYATLDSNLLTMIVCFGCMIVFAIYALITHQFALPPSLHTWLYLIALGVFATAIPIQLMLQGLKYISSIRASIISVLEPLVTVLVGVLLLGETLSWMQIMGATIILGGALLIQLHKEL